MCVCVCVCTWRTQSHVVFGVERRPHLVQPLAAAHQNKYIHTCIYLTIYLSIDLYLHI